MEKKLLNEQELEAVSGGVYVEGKPAEYDSAEQVMFTFGLDSFARVIAKKKRIKLLTCEVRFNEATGKYGAYYSGRDNAGVVEYFWENELSQG